MEDKIVFTARAIFAFSLDRLYRVYIMGFDLYFIQIGGQGGVAEGITAGLGAQLGSGGRKIGEGISSRIKSRQKEKEAEVDSLDPATLVKRGKKNFIARSTDFIEARIDPAPIFNTHGENCGRLKVCLRGDRKFTFQFEAIEDMKVAVEQLPRLIGPRLKINVEWREKHQDFVKRKKLR